MTLPKPLRFISKLNGDLLHNLLFKLSAEVICSWFKAKHNIRPGIVSVLHTAGADLKYHPHVHMIVSGGGQNISTNEIKTLKYDYLTKQRFLANKLRNLFISELHKNHKIILPKKWNKNPSQFRKWLKHISQKQWIVSIQKPLNDISNIIGYVGRYTKRACISEYKITNVTKSEVWFKFNDYKNTPRGTKPLVALIKMPIVKFLDSLLQHVPNKKYRMVRYYAAYSSHYLNQLPHNKIDFSRPIETPIDINELQDFKKIRTLDILYGKPDPFICPNCNTYLIFHKISYPYKNSYFDT